jgi:hypothetical protein
MAAFASRAPPATGAFAIRTDTGIGIDIAIRTMPP